MGRRAAPGLLLIVVGAVLLAIRTLSAGGEAVVVLIGCAFLVAYTFTREYGFLIPGGVMTGLGVGILVSQSGLYSGSESGAALLIGMGLGFVAIYVTDRLGRESPRPAGWWPLIPGGVLSLIGFASLSDALGYRDALAEWWPVTIVAIGLWSILRARERATPESADEAGDDESSTAIGASADDSNDAKADDANAPAYFGGPQ